MFKKSAPTFGTPNPHDCLKADLPSEGISAVPSAISVRLDWAVLMVVRGIIIDTTC